MRTRITTTLAVLVATALAGAGLIVYAIESQRLVDQSVREIEQELDEFAVLQQEESFTSVEALLRGFLTRNVPDDDELLVGWIGDGSEKVAFPSDDPLLGDPAFDDAVGPLVAEGGSTRLTTDPGGEHLVTVQAVSLRDGDETGALVVVVHTDEDREELLDTMRTYAVVAALSLLLITAIAAWQSGRLLAPLRALRETADEITETDLSLRLPVTGNDDITALTRTVNGMLDRLELAFVGQRQFLDDAGHELKTPLTVLRGHLELLDAASPAEVDQTRALLLDEVDRMARLVGDLILLAKSDRPDFVTPAPTPLTELTVEVLAKARALGPRAWTLDGAADVVVRLDEQRITQALLQLADNAVKHTHEGDVVAVGSSYDEGPDGGWVRLWVRDTGPGIAAADRELVFERFGRSRTSPDDEGFGLGLSIVAAIATAHHGTVHVEDAEPHGARVVLTLPATRTDVPAPAAEEDPWPAS
ncbi:HAMP domain-containing sensor histidine kinase [Nocardioides sp. SYSU D00038]|uniref:sensor histidine kinase n=1 Tax=Nocardioides sp. SYSU D00038 TaxID=2812554 RepID=UPI0027DB81E7|nr:HAMP domain-containing sensor histidine kinase [Nocardioides sp. SYSU D00038]